jgi:hypothetical protein
VFSVDGHVFWTLLQRKGIDMRYKVVMAMKMSVLVSWVVTLCGLVGKHRRFGGTNHPEDGGGKFLQNVGINLQIHKSLRPRKPISTQKSEFYTVCKPV